jgi:predicted nucleotidyltransferase
MWPDFDTLGGLAANSLSCRQDGRALKTASLFPEMTVEPQDDPVLMRFKRAVGKEYGSRIERIVLYGSRARGDARPDSNYDVAVFLRDLTDRWREMDRLADIGTEILDDVGKFVHATPYSAGAFRERTPLMHEIRKDGVDL